MTTTMMCSGEKKKKRTSWLLYSIGLAETGEEFFFLKKPIIAYGLDKIYFLNEARAPSISSAYYITYIGNLK